jgi:hypothetical protein
VHTHPSGVFRRAIAYVGTPEIIPVQSLKGFEALGPLAPIGSPVLEYIAARGRRQYPGADVASDVFDDHFQEETSESPRKVHAVCWYSGV